MRPLLVGFTLTAAAIGTILGVRTDAQSVSPVAYPAATNSPVLKALIRGINDEPHSTDLVVRSLGISIVVHGGISETVMDFDIAAPKGAQESVEGRIHIDLPAGAIVTGYALDVNGNLVDGSLVDQSTARAAFDNQVRAQVDPGLAAVDQLGDFNTRIFPVDSVKGRKFRLRFVAPIGEGYQLPLKLPAGTGRWSILVEGASGHLPKAELEGNGRLANIMDSKGQVFAGTGALNSALRIAPPKVEEALSSRHSTGEIYVQLAGKLPVQPLEQGGTMRIYWDRSRSRRDQDHRAEVRKVSEAITALKPDRIEWVAFSSGDPDREFITEPSHIEAKALKTIYGGATSFSTIVRDAPADNCLLVSDGRPTIDLSPLPTFPCRTFAIASLGADIVRLGRLSQATGGRLVMAGGPQIDWRAPSVVDVVGQDGRPLDFASLPAAPGEWRLVARAPKAVGPVRVRIGDVSVSRSPGPPFLRNDGDGAMMAASKLAAMDSAVDRLAYIALSRRYSVASPSLSFVVLEQPRDYVINSVPPPANYHRRREWEQLSAEAAEDLADARARRLSELRRDWQEQVRWWERRFDLNARPILDARKRGSADGAEPPARQSEAAPLPTVSPGPPPSPEIDGVVGPIAAANAIRAVNEQGARPQSASDVRISVSAWRPERDYLDAYDAKLSSFDHVFREWDQKAGGVPAFYLDTADWLYRAGQQAKAVETLTSALDLPTADEVTVGMVAGRLERWGMLDPAVALRERQAALDPERPQPKRLLALVLARRAAMGGPGAKHDLQRAIRLLTEIALSPTISRWKGIDLIALVEANALIPKFRALGGIVDLDARLVRNLDSDIRIVLDWSSDAVDIDLWVDQPNGERAIYNHPRTLIGGHLSDDMTEGFGPEEYFIRRGALGRYSVRANVYSPDRLDPNGHSRVTAHLYRDWGRPTQREESIDFELKRGERGQVKIGTLGIGEQSPEQR